MLLPKQLSKKLSESGTLMVLHAWLGACLVLWWSSGIWLQLGHSGIHMMWRGGVTDLAAQNHENHKNPWIYTLLRWFPASSVMHRSLNYGNLVEPGNFSTTKHSSCRSFPWLFLTWAPSKDLSMSCRWWPSSTGLWTFQAVWGGRVPNHVQIQQWRRRSNGFLLGTLKTALHWDFVAKETWLGTFLVGVDVDGTLDMRPGPIAKKYLGLNFGPCWPVRSDVAQPDTFLRYLSGWFIPDLLILMIDIVLFILTSQLALQFRLFAGGPGEKARFRDTAANSNSTRVASENSTPQALRTASLVRLLRLLCCNGCGHCVKLLHLFENSFPEIGFSFYWGLFRIVRDAAIIQRSSEMGRR